MPRLCCAYTVWYWLLGCHHPFIHVRKESSQQLLSPAVTGADARSWSCHSTQQDQSGNAWAPSVPGTEGWQTDPRRGGSKGRERKERKGNLCAAKQSSVLMLMFRLSQEFPRKGNSTAVSLGSPALLQPAALPIPLPGTRACVLAATGNSSPALLLPISASHEKRQAEVTALQTTPPEHPAHSRDKPQRNTLSALWLPIPQPALRALTVLSWPQHHTHSGGQRGFPKIYLLDISLAARQMCVPKPLSPPEAEQTPVSWAVTAVFEVALDSCRCTCAGSRGLCGTAQTAPCSLGSSGTSQQCCKAEGKGRQVRDMCHSMCHSRVGCGPWLDQLC